MQNCFNYQEIKLIGHFVKLWNRKIEQRLTKITIVSDNQFGFILERSIIMPIFSTLRMDGKIC